MDRSTFLYHNMRYFLSHHSKITICETEELACLNESFQNLLMEFVASDFQFEYLDESQSFLLPPFKTNLHEYLQDKRSLFFCNDNDRVHMAKEKTGIFIAGLNEEVELYSKLNFYQNSLMGTKLLSIGEDFNNYNDLEKFLLPFTEIIINEPFLFHAEESNYKIKDYIKNNFEPLIKSLFINVKNKVLITICTFVHESSAEKFSTITGGKMFDLYDAELNSRSSNGFLPLYDLCNNLFNELLGGDRYDFKLIISPIKRTRRHDRFVLTNYQYIETGSGLAFFDSKNIFAPSGESFHLYSIMNEDTRKTKFDSVLKNLQKKVIDPILKSSANRVYGKVNKENLFNDTHFLRFNI